MNNYFKFIRKNYSYITNYNNYYALIIILFFLFLFFIKKNYKLIILYSFFVVIAYFLFKKNFIFVLLLIPITLIFNFNFKENLKAPSTDELTKIAPTDTANTERNSENDAKNQIGGKDKNEPSKCEKMFLVQTNVPNVGNARRRGSQQEIGGEDQKAAAGTFEDQVNKIAQNGDITNSPLS